MEIFTIDQASAEVFGEMLPDSFETEDIITLGATEDGLALGVLSSTSTIPTMRSSSISSWIRPPDAVTSAHSCSSSFMRSAVKRE